jgi:hypothetical protein
MKPTAPLPYANALKTNGFGLLKNPCRFTECQADEPENKKKQKHEKCGMIGRLFHFKPDQAEPAQRPASRR